MTTIAFDIEVAGFPWQEVDEITRGYLLNRARSEEEANDVIERMGRVCERFLAARPLALGWLPDDPLVSTCVNRRGAVCKLEPEAPAAQALMRVELRLREALESRVAHGLGKSMLADVGYCPRLA